MKKESYKKYIPFYPGEKITLHLIDSFIYTHNFLQAIGCVDDVLQKDTNTAFDNILKSDSNTATLYNRKGFCFLALGMPDSAKINCQKSLALGHRTCKNYDYVAMAYSLKGDYKKELLYIDSSLQLDPNDAVANGAKEHLLKIAKESGNK